MQKNEEYEILISDVSKEGNGIGKYDGIAIFVPQTAIGDKVKVKIIKITKSYAIARLERVIVPSVNRINVDCPVFTQCGGCVYRHISYSSECDIKENMVYQTIKRIGGIDKKPNSIVPSSNYMNYRNKAQFPISENGKAGFYAFRSHRVIELDSCALQPTIFKEITQSCNEWIKKNNISIYNETYHKGLLRHIYIRYAESTHQIMICLVINADSLPHSDELTAMLLKICGKDLKSVQININSMNTNVILGDKCKVLFGDPYITDILCGIKIRISPMTFYQVNKSTTEKLYEIIAKYAKSENSDILDLYCGAGTIGLSMAKKAKSITGVEIIHQAIEDAKINSQINQITNSRFICSDADSAAKKLNSEEYRPDVVIVDPPRKGCSEQLILTICNDFAPKRIIYVSCDPGTLARDLKIFTETGYTLIEYTPVDMFPRTSHVETVALLTKV